MGSVVAVGLRREYVPSAAAPHTLEGQVICSHWLLGFQLQVSC